LKIIAGKINKIPEFYTIFARKMPDYIIKRDRSQAEAKTSRPRPMPNFWPRSHFGLEDLTSLVKSGWVGSCLIMCDEGGEDKLWRHSWLSPYWKYHSTCDA